MCVSVSLLLLYYQRMRWTRRITDVFRGLNLQTRKWNHVSIFLLELQIYKLLQTRGQAAVGIAVIELVCSAKVS